MIQCKDLNIEMCARSEWNSPGRSQERNKMRFVPRTRWELPIPRSYTYWDKICQEIEKNIQRVRYPFHHFTLIDPLLHTNVNSFNNNTFSNIDEIQFPREPIVKISPPTPSRELPQETNFNEIIVENVSNGNDLVIDTDYVDSSINSRDLAGSLSENGTRFLNVDCQPTDFLLNINKVYTTKSCPFHKNTPPIQFFDDNLKNVLPRGFDKVHKSGDDLSRFSKFSSKKSCPMFHVKQITANDKWDTVKSSKSENSEYRKILETDSSQKLYKKMPRFDKKLPKHSKIAIIEKNLHSMLNIPKLNEIRAEAKLLSNETLDSAINSEGKIDFDVKSKKVIFKTESKRKPNVSKLAPVNYSKSIKALSVESLQRTGTFSHENILPELSKNVSNVSSRNNKILPKISNKSFVRSQSAKYPSFKKLQDKCEQNLSKVQKLGSELSSYSRFNKPISAKSFYRSSDDRESSSDDRESSIDDLPHESPKQFQKSNWKIERDFLQVPKFSSLTIDNYDNKDIDGISSLRESSIYRNDKSLTKAESCRATSRLEPIDRSSRSNDPPEKRDAKTSRSKVTKNQKIDSRERRSFKYSVKYAYKALKFLTKNKNLDFAPKVYDPSERSTLSSDASSSSFDLSELTEANVTETGTYKLKSESSTSYESVRKRLREKASKFLGPDYDFSRAKATLKTPELEDTELSNVRTTSGSSSKFEKPILKNLSAETLRKIPEAPMLSRRNRDRCLACLHRTFEDPVKVKRELPLAIVKSILQESCPEVSDSESSSVTLPDLERSIDRGIEDNAEEIATESSNDIEVQKVSRFAQSIPTKTSMDTTKSILNLSEIVLPRSSSPKDSQVSKSTSRSFSVSSIGSKVSSVSGQTSESEESQVPTEQKLPVSKYFVSCHVPLNLRPSLEHLRALKYKKPVSMHSRSASAAAAAAAGIVGGSDLEDSSEESLSIRTGSLQDERDSKKKKKKKSSARNQLSWKSSNFEKNVQVKLESNRKSIDDVDGHDQVKITDHEEEPAEESNERKGSLGLVETANRFRTDPKEFFSPKDRQCKPILGKISTSASFDDSKTLKPTDSKRNVKLMQKRSKTSLKLNLTPSFTDLTKSVDQSDNTETSSKQFENKILKFTHTFNPSSLESDSTGFSSGSSTVVEDPHDKFVQSSKFDPPSVLNEMVLNIIKRCIESNLSSFDTLKTLSDEFLRDTFVARDNFSDMEVKKSVRLARNLIKLLVESKRYLDPAKFPTDIEFSSKQPPPRNSRQLRRVLPLHSYNLVAPILGIPKWFKKKVLDNQSFIIKRNRHKKCSQISFDSNKSSIGTFDKMVHPPSREGHVSFYDNEIYDYPKLSSYALFMTKPRRKAVTWRALREEDLLGYDPEATLNMRATRVTNKICEDFCQWLSSLGGAGENGIDAEVIRDMFEIDFSADTCRTMQVLIKEMSMVPTVVALTRNSPAAGELALTRRHLIKDVKAERRSKRTIGFGSGLPQDMVYVPPNNRVEEKWLQCENVPKDLETMDAVWKGITHLDSVKGFLEWLKDHPNVKPPKALEEALLNKIPVSRQSQDVDGFAHLELDLDQIKSLKVGDDDTDVSD